MAAVETPAVLAERYRFDAELGAGTQGRTWRATRLADDLPVAVKVLHLANVDNWKAVELFEREAEALATVSDVPGVPDLIEYVSLEPDAVAPGADPVFYLVQALAPGRSLGDRLSAGERFTEAQAVEIALRVLDILGALHARNPPIIHRDLKPGNILLADDGTVSLVDFGTVTAAVRSTGEGSTVAGTVGYMAPEQFQGRAVPGSDLYGLGATLAHMLSGVPPAQMDTTVFKLEFEPHVTHCSPGLRAVLSRLLEPDHEQRFDNAASVADALRGSLTQGALVPVEDDSPPMPVANAIGELKIVGQPGHMALFHATPSAPRKVPGMYARAVLARYALYVGGGALVGAIGAMGVLTILGIMGPEAALFLFVPFFFGYWLYRGNKRFKHLVRNGRKAVGTVEAVRELQDAFSIVYSFEAGGRRQGATRVKNVTIVLEPGDEVGLLYDPQNPDQSMLYPLPAKAAVAAMMQDDDE